MLIVIQLFIGKRFDIIIYVYLSLIEFFRLPEKFKHGLKNLKIGTRAKHLAVTSDKRLNEISEHRSKIIPESVNYHFTRTCNYSCGFCFHTAKTSFNLPLEEAKRGLQMLVKEGMKKVCLLNPYTQP